MKSKSILNNNNHIPSCIHLLVILSNQPCYEILRMKKILQMLFSTPQNYHLLKIRFKITLQCDKTQILQHLNSSKKSGKQEQDPSCLTSNNT